MGRVCALFIPDIPLDGTSARSMDMRRPLRLPFSSTELFRIGLATHTLQLLHGAALGGVTNNERRVEMRSSII